MAAMKPYLRNKLIDQLLRGQAYSFPSILYFGLLTTDPEEGDGTEVSADSYNRAAVVASLANFSGTQGAGTTTASSGTDGPSYNNTVIEFPDPLEAWGVLKFIGVFDAATGGNMLLYGTLANPKTINAGDDAPSFPASSFSYKIDKIA